MIGGLVIKAPPHPAPSRDARHERLLTFFPPLHQAGLGRMCSHQGALIRATADVQLGSTFPSHFSSLLVSVRVCFCASRQTGVCHISPEDLSRFLFFDRADLTTICQSHCCFVRTVSDCLVCSVLGTGFGIDQRVCLAHMCDDFGIYLFHSGGISSCTRRRLFTRLQHLH